MIRSARLPFVLLLAAIHAAPLASARAQEKKDAPKEEPKKEAPKDQKKDDKKGEKKDAPKSAPVELQLMVVRATNKNSEISPQLKDLPEKLKQFRFKGYKLEKTINGKAEIGKEFPAELIDGYSGTVTPKARTKEKDKERVQLHVVISKKGVEKPETNTTFTIDAGTSLPIAGPALSDGDTLFVLISAK
jgi:hypothetical protein